MAALGGGPQSFAGFEVRESLGTGASSVVYRATRDGKTYAVKIMQRRPGQEDVEAALRFRREAAALARVNHPGVVRVVEAGEQEGRAYLAMELAEGGSLRELRSDGPMEQAQLVEVASVLSEALGEVHRHGLVHRDLKPENILFDAAGRPKLIDFGIAVAAVSSRTHAVAGTLLYSSPEQTGMLKRPVDGRSDLYSLGIVLYECATGQRPFDTEDVGRLLQMHASTPVPPPRTINDRISPAFAAIIEKLCAKDPDDRYQSGEGLRADLERIHELDAQALAGELRLGQRDRFAHSAQQLRLVGRDVELAALKKAWARLGEGTGSVALVEGEGGLGKSRLCQELLNLAEADGATILTTKCQATEQVPFAPIREAVDDYLTRSFRSQGEEWDAVKEKVLAACGDYAPILKRLSNGLSRLIGEVPQLPPADPNVEQDRFFGAVSMFFAELARQAGGLVLLIDDVQWLDDGTSRVLERVAGLTDDCPLLLLATSRSTDENAAARDAFVRAMGDALKEHIALKPLGTAAVGELLVEHLGGEFTDDAFTARLTSFANGNPFAIGEYVRRLIELGKLRPSSGGWTIDAANLSELDLPKDVLQLVISRVSSLSEESRSVLTTAASIGQTFSRSLLIEVVGSEEKVLRGLAEAARGNLIEQPDEGTFALVHDRIREALEKASSEDELKDIHQRIAEVLEKESEPAPSTVYALARHHALGHADKHPVRVFETSFAAGGLALQSYSNREAYEFLNRALLAGHTAKIPAENLGMLVYLLGIASMLTGRYDEANRYLSQAIEQAPNDVARAQGVMLLCYAKAGNGRTDEAWDDLVEALVSLGEPLPTEPTTFKVLDERVRSLVKQPLPADDVADRELNQTLCALYDLGVFLITLTLRPELALDFGCRHLEHALKLGVSDMLARAYGNLTLGYALTFDRERVYELAKLAQQIAGQLGDRAAVARAKVTLGVAQTWLGELIESEHTLNTALPEIEKWLGEFFYSINLGSLIWNQYARGLHRESAGRLTRELPRYDRAHNLTFSALQRAELFASNAVLGNVAESLRWRDDAYRIAAPYITPEGIRESYLRGALRIYSAFAFYELDDLEACEKEVEDFRAMGKSDFYFAACYVTAAYLRLARVRRGSPKERTALWAQLEEAVKELANPAWASPVYTCHLDVVRAAMALEERRFSDADAALTSAEQTAERIGSEWGAFEALRERARLESARNRPLAAGRCALAALDIAQRNGWQLRARRVQGEFEVGGTSSAVGRTVLVSTSTHPSTNLGEHGGVLTQRHVEALLEVSLASAGSRDPEQQARAALDQIIKLLAAQRGFLFLKDDAGALNMLAGRDDANHDIAELKGYSSTVVAKVAQERKATVVTGTAEGAMLGSESAVAFDLRSIIAAPLMLRDELLGVVYLDSTLAKGLFTEDDVKFLTAIANHIAIAVETARSARLELEREALERELQLTGAVQAFFLPRSYTLKTSSAHLVGSYQPAEQCSGDWFWWEERPDGSLIALVGDVTGHGAAPAMVTASVASAYQTLQRLKMKLSLEEILEQLHAQLRSTANGGYTMTFTAAELDVEGNFRCVFAGAPPIMIHEPGSQKPRVVSGRGAPLGSVSFILEAQSLKLEPGSRVFIFTDGLSELPLPRGRQLGLRALSKVFTQVTDAPIGEAADLVVQALDEARKDVPRDDDVTFLLIDRVG